MAESAAERTEPATPRRLEEARARGEVAQSRDVAAWLGLAGALALLLGEAGARLAGTVATIARQAWSGAVAPPAGLGDFHALLLANGGAASRALAPVLAGLMAVAVAGPLLQNGPLLATQAFRLRLERLNPVMGLRRLASVDRLFDLAKALVKLAAILAVATWVLAPRLDALMAHLWMDPAETPAAMRAHARALVAPLLALLAAIAVLDVAWVRHRYARRMRMTRQEVREEILQREGNPQVRARLRQTARELTRLRLQAEVGRADVVVRNPTHFAVALAYDRTRMGAPTVVAKGRGRVALRILELARAAEVPIVEDPPLARLLFRTVRVGREIPVELYEAVAEVLAWVYRLDRRRAAAWGVAS